MIRDLVEVRISGKNIKRFILKLHKLNISLLKITYLSADEALAVINKNQLPTVLKNKTIYNIEIISFQGLTNYKKLFKVNRIFLLALVFGYLVLIMLSNLVFSIDVIHTDKNLVNFIMEKLEDEGIKKYSLRKKYSDLRNITNKIINNNKERIEWLEIEVIGTKYRILVEERLTNPEIPDDVPRNIVAKKAGIITSLNATSGIAMKSTNSFVNKGDLIISGTIPNRNGDILIRARGEVYAEVWYTVTIEQPLVYKEEFPTGKKKTNYCLNLFNNNLCLFRSYTASQSTTKNIISNPILPFAFIKRDERELRVIDDVYTPEEAILIAINKGKKKIAETLNEKEYIISEKVLKKVEKDSTIEVEIFYKVYENITLEEIINKE